MADFLSRLVERSAGMAPIVRPAVAPLFAPGPAMAAEPAPLGLEPVGVVPQGPAPGTAPIPSAPTPVLREAPTTDFSRPDRFPARTLPVVPPATPRETAHGALRPTAAAPPETPRRGAVHEHRPPPPEEFPVRVALTPSGAQGPSAIPRRSPAWEDGPRVDTAIRSVASPVLRPRDERPPRRAEDLRPPGSPEASAAPIVRISIGRIEVRAVAPSGPAAPRPAPPRKSTGVSLEEYLKPRSRGG
jgi:hypothetical protein